MPFILQPSAHIGICLHMYIYLYIYVKQNFLKMVVLLPIMHNGIFYFTLLFHFWNADCKLIILVLQLANGHDPKFKNMVENYSITWNAITFYVVQYSVVGFINNSTLEIVLLVYWIVMGRNL